MKPMSERAMKMGSSPDSPLPMGDKAHKYPEGASISGGKYPDTPEMVAAARNKVVKDVKASMKEGLRN